MEQEHGLGLAHDVGAPHHDAVLAGRVDVVGVQHLHDARRGAGQEIVIADHDLAHVGGVERVHVLGRVDMQQHLLLVVIVPPGQGQLAQDAVDLRPGVQGVHQLQQRLLSDVGGQGELLAVKPALLAVLPLAGDVHPGRRVIAHQNDRQPGAAVQFLRLLGHLCLCLRCKLLAVNVLCRHWYLRPFSFQFFVPLPPAG